MGDGWHQEPVTFPWEGGAFTFAKAGCRVSYAPAASRRPRVRSREAANRNERNADMAKQMTVEDRKRIDFLLQLGWTPAQIAEDRGRSKSTILHEIINRSVPCDRGYRCSNRICALFDACPRVKGYGRDAKRSFRCTPRCFEVCPDFVERACGRLDVPSRVCNGCRDFRSCPMMKRLYVADGAQANRESLLHDSRAGVHPDAEALARMNAVLSPCIMRGQSVRNVVANNPEAFGSVKERTVYDYIAGGLFDAKRGDLPEACSRKARKKKKETKTNAKCRAGRDYRTFLEFCRVNEVREWTELDTVVGRVGGKVLFTMILPGGLMLMFLRDRKSSQTCTRVFNMLWELAGPELFQRLFFVILTDNGAEFSDPDMIEKWRPDPEHNPTKLLPRGIHLFYCDAYCSSQKPRVEREHREERRVLLHGVSFDTLTQDDVNLVASHVASYSRGVLDNQTPYDTFVEKFGEPGKKLLDALGVVKIPPNEVTLDPILLGEKFKRHADRVILRKAGVIPPKKTDEQK